MIVPILRKELIGSGRHGRYFAVRGAYLVLLACVTVPALIDQARKVIDNPGFQVSRMGQEFTITFGLLQFVLVVLLAPAFSIGTLASEKATGGLDLLHCAGVGAGSVVAGKYAARLAWLVLFMISGVPLFMAGTLMGGVGMETVALLFVHVLVAGALGTSLGFTLSGGMRQTVPALVLCYLALAALYIGAPMVMLFYDEAIPGTSFNDEIYGWVNPIAAVLLHSDGKITSSEAWAMVVPHVMLAVGSILPAIRFAAPDDAGDSDPSVGALAVLAALTGSAVLLLGAMAAGPTVSVIVVFFVQAVLAATLAVMLAFSMRGIARRVSTRLLLAGALVAIAWLLPGTLLAALTQRFPGGVSEASLVSPIVAAALVREGWTPAVLVPTVGFPIACILLGFLILGRRARRLRKEESAAAIAMGGKNDPAPRAVRKVRETRIYGNPIAWRDGRGARRGLAARILRWAYLGLGGLVILAAVAGALASGFRDDDFGQIAILLLVTGGTLVAVIVGSGAITEERERRAMPLLTLSRLTAGDVLLGKLWGLVVYLGPVAVLPPLVALIFFAKDEPGTFFATIVMTSVMLFAGASFGLLFSSFMKRSATSAGAAMGFVVVYCTMPPILYEMLNLRSMGDLLTVFNPLATVIELVDDFGKNRRNPGDFALALTGLGFLFVSGVTCAVLAWTALQTQEET